MKFKPILLLVLLVTIPLALLTWLGLRMADSERDLMAQRTRELLSDRLRDIDQSTSEHMSSLARDLEELTSIDSYSPGELRKAVRQDARVLQLFVIRPDGSLLHPDPAGTLNRNEQEFLARASQIVIDRDLQRAAEGSTDMRGPDDTASLTAKSGDATTQGLRAGWFTWYWGRGLNLVYWQRRPDGHIVGVALERSRWISDLIASLPDTPFSDAQSPLPTSLSQIRLIDSTSQTVYQWGPYTPDDAVDPVCEIPLSEPLSAWRLQQYVPPDRLISGAGRGALFNIGSGLAAAALGLITIGAFLFREYSRDMQEARQRVSFVNQVSHELRTPLTNIRIYADLLESDLDPLPADETQQPRQRLKVIHSESQRLHRIIGNVLSFARQQRKTLALHQQPGCVDVIVRDVLDRFRPFFVQQKMEVEFQGSAAQRVLVDADALEQMLDNLLSNVEKYASEGRWVRVTTTQEGDCTAVTVSDRGPGIPQRSKSHVFEPFWRGSDQLTHAAGTGIGLSIARELARLHGGDVTLQNNEQGATFRIEIQTPLAEGAH